MNNGNLKYRHFHWVVIGRNDDVAERQIIYRVIAESEEEAMQISTSISKRDMFVVCEVNECFTPHDYEEQLELQRKLIDKFPSKE